jgi:hypothetical protein
VFYGGKEMLNSLFKSLLITLPMLLSMAIYYKVDKEYAITDKIGLKIKVDTKWKPFLVICCSFLLALIFGIIGIYVISIPTNLYFILSSLIFGLGLGLANKLLSQNKNT